MFQRDTGGTRQNGLSDQDYRTHAGPYSVILRLVEADIESQLMIEKWQPNNQS